MNNLAEDEVNEIPLRSNFLVLLTTNSLREIKSQSSLSQVFLNLMGSLLVWTNQIDR